MTVPEIKRTLLEAHDHHGFFPAEVVKSILKDERQHMTPVLEIVCCMLELVYMSNNNKENNNGIWK